MNKILAIKGHPTRGKEVIKILEMLGGNNKYHINDTECNLLYTIREGDNVIIGTYPSDILQIYTLEEFLQKYPYKVGDNVKSKGLQKNFTISDMFYTDNIILYKIDECFWVTVEELQPYKEENYTEYAVDDDSKTDITIDGEKLIAPNGYTVKTATMDGNNLIVEYIKNKPQYPKTYKECCDVLGIGTMDNDAQGYKADDIIRFQELLIARDAYWKIAGEEMGLSEPWEPNFGENFIYAIGASYGTIQKIMVSGGRGILLFPTEEMCDAFFKNFKDLIEKCKEML